MTERSKYRPAVEDRDTEGFRTEPVLIRATTEWLYAERRPGDDPDKPLHAFSTGVIVTGSDVPSKHASLQDLDDHVDRAVMAFGDDKDIVVEVRLAGDAESDPVQIAAEALAPPRVGWHGLLPGEQDDHRATAERAVERLSAAGLLTTDHN